MTGALLRELKGQGLNPTGAHCVPSLWKGRDGLVAARMAKALIVWQGYRGTVATQWRTTAREAVYDRWGAVRMGVLDF